jgi:hypothetical protein
MPLRPVLAALVSLAAFAAAPAAAHAAPPANDNYLASTSLNSPGQALRVESTDTVDTTEATTQPDLFNPSATGAPLGGAGPENTTCDGVSFGKTVWYDFHPNEDGDAEVDASGFDTVITVYEWDLQSSKITSTVACKRGSRLDLLSLKKGKAYTIQIGGANNASGLLNFTLDWFGDADDDGILEPDDKCPKDPGIQAAGGCPPQLGVSPALGFANASGGVTISRLVVTSVPKGAKLVASCPGCGSETIKAKRTVKAGAKIQLKVTLPPSGKGKYKYGAVGKRFTWPVRSGGLGTRTQRCLNARSGKVQSCS